MSKDKLEEIRREQLYDDEDDLIVNRQSKSDFTLLPIIIALFVIYLLFNVLSENKSVVKDLADSISSEETTPNLQSTIDVSKASNIHQLVSKGDVNEIKQQLLILNSINLNEVVSGMTPIMLAASQGNVEIIDLLFTQGADPNTRGSMQRTALQYATEKNHIKAVKRLLAYGADIDAYDNGRLTPLVMAASRGHSELALLFIEKGADVNIQHSQGWTALIDAVAHGDTKLVNALLEAGADKELVAENGKRAIDYAKEYEFKNIEKMLGN
jgi:ankyrin repeat protein